MINDFESLRQAISNWLARADLEAVIPTFIQLAEIRIFNDPDYKLRVRQMLQVDTGTATGGVINLPEDYLEIQSLSLNWSGIPHPLTPAASEALARARLGTPRNYVVLGNQIRIVGQETTGEYELVYYARPEPLEQAGQNWLILEAPNVYLYGALLEASPYLKADARIEVWGAGLKEALRGLKNADYDARYGPGVRVPVVVPNAP